MVPPATKSLLAFEVVVLLGSPIPIGAGAFGVKSETSEILSDSKHESFGRHFDRVGHPGRILHPGMDFLCQEAVPGLRTSPPFRPVDLLCQLYLVLYHV